MLPRSNFKGARRSRRAAEPDIRAALLVAWLVVLALILMTGSAKGATASPELREKDVRRAEKVVAKLRLLDEAAATGDDAGMFRARAAKLYPGLFVTVAEMRESDLKTDLDTAAFLYDEARRAWFAAGTTTADCGRERLDIYRPLCFALRGGNARQLLLSKARLHLSWAEAVIKTYKGEGNSETARALSEMKAARENDLIIAARITESLKNLERLVHLPRTYADYQEQRTASNVSFERLEGEFAEALGFAGALLAWMPRSPTFYRLSNARNDYRDGLFWHRKVQQSRKLVVSADGGFQRDPLKDLGLDADRAGYTVVTNWRSAARYIRRAEQSLARGDQR